MTWQFTVDGAAATCTDVGSQKVGVTIDGPGELVVGGHYPDPYLTFPCSDGGVDVTGLEVGESYQVSISIAEDAFGGWFLNMSEGGTYAGGDAMNVSLDLASVDVSWQLADNTDATYLVFSYGSGTWIAPYAPSGAARLLVLPGEEMFQAQLDANGFQTLYEARVLVPAQGTTIALTQ